VPAETEPAAATALAVFAFEDGEFSPSAEALDAQLDGAIRRAIAASRFKGSLGQSLQLPAPSGTAAGRGVVIGAGKQDVFDATAAEAAAAHAFGAAKDTGSEEVLLRMGPAGPERQAHAAFGVQLGSYRFDKYRTTEKPEKKPSVAKVRIAVADVAAAQ